MVSGLLCSVMTAARQVSMVSPFRKACCLLMERLKRLKLMERLERFQRFHQLQWQFVKRLCVAPKHGSLVVLGDFIAVHELTEIMLTALVGHLVGKIGRIK